MTVKKGLGKGLGALITSNEDFVDMDNEKRSGVIDVDINRIEPNVNQTQNTLKRNLYVSCLNQ